MGFETVLGDRSHQIRGKSVPVIDHPGGEGRFRPKSKPTRFKELPPVSTSGSQGVDSEKISKVFTEFALENAAGVDEVATAAPIGK